MRELSTRKRIITVVVGLVAMVFVVNQVLLEPQSRKVRELRGELASLNEKIASLGPKMVEFENLNSNIIEKKKKLTELEEVFSHRSGVAEVIHEVSSQAKAQGLQIQNLRPQRDTVLRTGSGRQGEFRRLLLNLGVRGSYEQLGDFLGGLEQQPYYVKVAKLRVERGRESPEFLHIQLQLQIVVRS
jgi:Tfp pilus assembly protein PilO